MEQLLDIGFNEQQCKKLITNNIADKVIRIYEKLNRDLTPTDITRLAAIDDLSLDELDVSCEKLLEMGFSNSEILRIVAQNTGVNNIRSTIKSFDTLKGLGLLKQDIVMIVARTGGDKIIDILTTNIDLLQELWINRILLLKLVGNGSGFKIIKALIDAVQTMKITAPGVLENLWRLFVPGKSKYIQFLNSDDYPKETWLQEFDAFINEVNNNKSNFVHNPADSVSVSLQEIMEVIREVEAVPVPAFTPAYSQSRNSNSAELSHSIAAEPRTKLPRLD